MQTKVMFRILAGLLVLSLMIGCKASPQPTNPTLTFAQGKCTYSGPKTVSAGGFKLDLVIPQNTPGSGYVLTMLNSGKTIEDLRAWKIVDTPPWATDLEYQGPWVMNTSFTYTLKYMGAWHSGEPLYLVCLQLDSKGATQIIGAFGPINVKS